MKWHAFSRVVTDVTSKFKKIKASNYLAQGRYKIIDQSKEPIAGYTDDVSLVNGQLLPILIFGDHTRVLKYEDDPIALGADGAKALWVDPNIADARYVYYFLRSIQIKEAGYSRHFKFLKEVEIPIPFKDGRPDFSDQIRIVHLLSKVEGLIVRRKKTLQQLDELLKSIFLEIFGDPVRNEKGWKISSLSSYGSFKNGLNFSKGESGSTVRYLGVGDFKSKTKLYDIDNLGFVELNELPVQEYFLQDSDLLFVRSNGNRELVGRCMAIYPGDEIVTYSGFCIRYRINSPALQATYITHLFRSAAFRRVLLQGGQGANIQNINQQILSDLPIPVPEEKLQNQFSTIVEKVETLKLSYQKSLNELEDLFSVLNQRVFKGDLDLSLIVLPVAPIGGDNPVESASMPPQNPDPTIHQSENEMLLLALENREQLKPLLRLWLEEYCAQLGDEVFSVDKFMVTAQNRVAVLHSGNSFVLRTNDYDHIKDWVFEALADGRLKQVMNITGYDDNGDPELGNLIELKAVQA